MGFHKPVEPYLLYPPADPKDADKAQHIIGNPWISAIFSSAYSSIELYMGMLRVYVFRSEDVLANASATKVSPTFPLGASFQKIQAGTLL